MSSMPAPNLDDRRFQDLVDDAKRLVQQHCREWTDHNVSDPGVTLIETFAYMVDQLFYRLNRVPDRLYVKFLDLIGVQLFPPAAARAPVTFWLSAPQPGAVTVASGAEVATMRTETEDAVAFNTVEPLAIVPTSVSRLAAAKADGNPLHHPETVADDEGFFCFDRPPAAGDALLVGLADAVPSCAVALQFSSGATEGVGVDPRNPPIVWEAWTGSGWSGCEVDHDDTGGLNRSGEIVLHVPRGHVHSLVDRQRAAWLRCRVVGCEPGQPPYSSSPRVDRLTAFTAGGTVEVIQAETIEGEEIGVSEGVAGQCFALSRRPVLPADPPLIVESAGVGGWQDWTAVQDFAASGPADRVFRLDHVAAEVVFGPAVREPDGRLRQYGAVPDKGAALRVRAYHTGGGRRGNVAKGAISVLKSPIPYITRIENRRPASGGVDGEDVDGAKARGPLALQSRNRAVTVADYEQLARTAAPEVARVRCVPATDATDPGVVRLLVVPAAADDELGRIRFERLVPVSETLRQIGEHLDERRVVGTRLVVEPPLYRGITVVAQLRARSRRADAEELRRVALRALYRYFHPVVGGPDGHGWPFGRPVANGEVYAVLQPLPGVEIVEEVRLFPADPLTGERGGATQRLEIEPNALVFSYEHVVRVQVP